VQKVASLALAILAVLAAAVWATGLNGSVAGAAATSTLGATTVGTTTAKPGANSKFGDVYALSQAGTLGDFRFYTKGGSVKQSFVAVVYAADDAGSPTNLIAQSQPVTIPVNQSAGWTTLTMPAVNVQPGNYLLGVLSGPTKNGAYLYYGAAPNAGDFNANTYPTPTMTWGTVSHDNRRWSFYVEITPTPAPPAPTPPSNTLLPAINGDGSVGGVVTTTYGTWSGSPAPTYTVQWYGCSDPLTCAPIDNATGLSHTVTTADAGQSLETVVTATNSAASTQATSAAYAMPPVAPPSVGSMPSITGTPQVGQTLNAAPGQWAGNPAPSYSLQWQSCAADTCADIQGAVANSYLIAQTDVGAALQVVVTATSTEGTGSASSGPTAPVTAASVITPGTLGNPVVGTLTAKPGASFKFGNQFVLGVAATVTDLRWYTKGGTSSQSFVGVVYAVDALGNPTTLVSQSQPVTIAAGQPVGWATAPLGATTLQPGSYLVGLLAGGTKNQATNYFRSATGAGYYNANAYPTPTSSWGSVSREDRLWSLYVDYTTSQPVAPVNLAVPKVTGDTVVGGTVTASLGSWNTPPAGESYQWQACADGSCTDIAGATANGYTVAATDVANTLRVLISAFNDVGSTTVASPETGVVYAPGTLTVEQFAKYVIDPTPAGAVVEKALADINGDGRLDAVIGTEKPEKTNAAGGIFWYEFPASGNPADPWIRHTILAAGHAYEDMAPYDIDGDGLVDIVASINTQVAWFRNPGPTGGAWVQTLIGNGGTENTMRLADIDGDGKLDVAASSGVYFQNSPTNWTRVIVGTAKRSSSLLDIGSGLSAINLVTDGPASSIVWYENPREHGGNARTDPWTMYTVGPGYDCAFCAGQDVAISATADLTGDGRMDIVVGQAEADTNDNAPPGGLRWFEMPPDPTQPWIGHTLDSSLQFTNNIRIADIDGNGSPDVVAGAGDQASQPRAMVYYNNGTGGFVPSQISSNGDGTHSVAVADVEADGDFDVLGGQHGYFGAPDPLSLYVNGRFLSPPSPI
jgi:hypothetical protein